MPTSTNHRELLDAEQKSLLLLADVLRRYAFVMDEATVSEFVAKLDDSELEVLAETDTAGRPERETDARRAAEFLWPYLSGRERNIIADELQRAALPRLMMAH